MTEIRIIKSRDKEYLDTLVNILHYGMDNQKKIYPDGVIEKMKENHSLENVAYRILNPEQDQTYFGHFTNQNPTGILVGYEGFRPKGQEDMIGSKIYWVVAGETGKGIGTEMIEYFVDRAKERDENFVTLGVYEGNPAQDLYKKLGFVPIGRGPEGLIKMARYIDEE